MDLKEDLCLADSLLREAAGSSNCIDILKSSILPLFYRLKQDKKFLETLNFENYSFLSILIELVEICLRIDKEHKKCRKMNNSSKYLANNTSRKRANFETPEELDSFILARRDAIEKTILKTRNGLPKLDDIVGLENAKQALSETLIDPILYPDWFTDSSLKPWKCILLFGPPGTGKSCLAKAISRKIPGKFYQVSSSDLISSWSGQSEKLIKELFNHAYEGKETSVIFIDEIDSLCRKRTSNEEDSNRRIKTELLLQLDGLNETENKILFLCATNCPWDLDVAFLRRFEKRIFVGLPEKNNRIVLLKKLLSSTPMSVEMDWEKVGEMSVDFSGDDLQCIVREIAFRRFRSFKNALKSGQSHYDSIVTQEDVENYCSLASFSVDNETNSNSNFDC